MGDCPRRFLSGHSRSRNPPAASAGLPAAGSARAVEEPSGNGVCGSGWPAPGAPCASGSNPATLGLLRGPAPPGAESGQAGRASGPGAAGPRVSAGGGTRARVGWERGAHAGRPARDPWALGEEADPGRNPWLPRPAPGSGRFLAGGLPILPRQVPSTARRAPGSAAWHLRMLGGRGSPAGGWGQPRGGGQAADPRLPAWGLLRPPHVRREGCPSDPGPSFTGVAASETARPEGQGWRRGEPWMGHGVTQGGT